MQGVGGIQDIEARLKDFWRDPAVVELGNDRRGEARWSTEALRQLEATALVRAGQLASQHQHALSVAQVEPILHARPTASTEQIEAIRYLCERSGAVAIVEGLPGTGKSFLLDAARAAWERAGWERAGYTVIGAALSGKAAQGLQESAGIPSATLHARLRDWSSSPGALNAQTVVVVDEAGMVDSRKLAALIDLTQAAGAKLVLVGDHRQLQPIEAGGLFRALTERIETATLSAIRRQVDPWAREAASAIAEGRVGEALAAYEQRGFVHVGATKADAVRALVAQWVEAGEQQPAASRLMLAGERADVRALNAQARDRLQQSGQLDTGPSIVTAHGPREIAMGDRLVCTRNSRHYAVRNGQLGTVEAMTGTGQNTVLQLRLDDGQRRVELPIQHYPHVDHGYALTTHKAQGVTVDQSFVLVGGRMADREVGLVQLSRHRESAHLFVDRSFYEAERLEHGPDPVIQSTASTPTFPRTSNPSIADRMAARRWNRSRCKSRSVIRRTRHRITRRGRNPARGRGWSSGDPPPRFAGASTGRRSRREAVTLQ